MATTDDRSLKGYEIKPFRDTDYLVTTDGRVFRDGNQLSPMLDSHGYKYVNIYINTIINRIRIHRMVAETFIPNPNNLPEINHKDGNKCNNKDWNLEWATHSSNIQHAYDIGLITVDRKHMSDIARLSSGGQVSASKMSISVIQLVGNTVIAVFKSIREASRSTGIQSSGIARCCKGEYKQYKGYEWRYAE